jgi:hypothetical protein
VFTVIVLIGALLLVTAALRLARLVRRTPKPAQEGQVSDTTPTQNRPDVRAAQYGDALP